jgi:hypothetical protein
MKMNREYRKKFRTIKKQNDEPTYGHHCSKLPFFQLIKGGMLAVTLLMGHLTLAEDLSEVPVTVPFEFAHMGDTAYNPKGISDLNTIIAQINADPTIKFVIHVGDTHGEFCTLAVYQRVLAQFNTIFQPVFLTPGDNDWTDCSEEADPTFHEDPLATLALVRQLFYYDQMNNPNSANGVSLGQTKINTKRQTGEKGLVENQRFVYNNIMFTSLHIVGSSDNCIQRNVGGATEGSISNPPFSCSSEHQERQAANIKWLKKSFEQAREDGLNGVVVFSQLLEYTPGFINADGTCVNQLDTDCKVYEPYRIALNNEMVKFKKPVAVLYGDKHVFTVNYPEPTLPNFVNTMTMGSPDTGFVRVKVDPSDPKLFSFSVGGCIFRAGSASCDPTLAGKVNVIAKSTVEIPNNADSCGTSNGRRCESLVGDVVTDMLRLATSTDFSLHNSGGIRAGLTCPAIDVFGDTCLAPTSPPPPYDITDGKVILALPFTTNLVTRFSMSGVELKSWLENGVSNMPAASGRFPQISGLCFQYDIAQPVGSRVIPGSAVRQAANGSCTGTAVDLTATDINQYSMTTIDFVANGGDGYPTIPAARQTLLGEPVQDIVQTSLSSVGTISPQIQGRIVCIDSNGATAPNCPVTLP